MRNPEKIVLGTICLLLLSKSYAEHGWKPRVEHTFALDGRTVAGIPSMGQQQHSGIRYRGILRVQRDASGILLLKLQNMTYTKLHENLPEGWWSSTDNALENFRELPITSSTVAVRLGRHGVETVSLKSGLEDWEMNLVQGIVSQLQIDSKTLKTSHKGKKDQINTSYKMMENSVFGRCEVLYEATRVPRSVALARPDLFPSADMCGNKNFVEIFKTRNFTNCEYGAEFHFGLPASKECHPGGNACQDFWNRASLTRLSGCGDQHDFRILQSETNSRVLVNLHIHKGSEASVSSYITMNLVSMKETSRRFSPPADPVVLPDLKFKFTHVNGHKDICPMTEEIEKNLSEYTEESRNKTSPTSNDKAATDEIPKSMDTTNPNTTRPAVSNKERNQWELGLLGLHNPPHQPLIPYALGLQGYEGSFQQIQKLKEMIADVARDFEESKLIHEKMTLEKVLAAVRICRTMTLFDLKRAVSSVDFRSQNNKEHLTESKVYRDVLVMCGTNPAFHILRTWIEQKELTGEEASQVLATMPAQLQTPGPDIVRQFYDMIRSPALHEDPQLKVTSLLAFSHLLRIACVDCKSRYAQYTDETFDATCELRHASPYISWFASMLRSDASLRRVYVSALGNTGAVAALGPLKAVAEDVSVSPYQRASAVLAMKYQALSFPEQTSQILFSLYHDVGQPVAVRVSAVSLLFYTKPQLVLLQRIAVLTWYDPSLAVAAFVRSSLMSLANLQDPLFTELSRYASMVLALAKPVALGLHRSHNFMWSRVSGGLQEVIFSHLSHETSLDATNFYYRYTHRLGGLSRVAFQGDVFVSNPDQFLTMLRELMYPRSDTSQARPAIENIERHTSWLRKNLKIAERTLPKLEGDFRIQLGKFVERIFPFDKELPAELAQAGRKLVEQMKAGKDFHYQKVDKTTIRTAVVTELGFPINFELSVPWAVRLVGNAKLNVESKMLEMDVDMMYTSHLLSELSFFTTWDESVHMAASHGVSFIRLPPTKLTAVISKSDIMQLGVKMVEAQDDSLIFHHSSKPFTSQHGIFDSTTATRKKWLSVIHAKRSTQKWNSLIPNININYTTEGPNISPLAWLRNGINIQGHLMMWPTLEASSIAVELGGLNSVNFELSFGRKRGNESLMFTEEQVNSAPNVSDTEFLGQQNVSSATTSLGQVTTTERSFWFGDRVLFATFSQNNATTNNTETKIPFNDTTARTAASADFTEVTAEASANRTEIPAVEDTTHTSIIVMEHMEHSHLSFNASNFDPFFKEVNGSRYKYLLALTLVGIHSGNAYVVDLNTRIDGTDSRNFSTLWSYAAGYNGGVHRFGFFLREAARQVRFTCTLTASATPMLKLESIIRSNATAAIHADLVYNNNKTKYQLSLKTVMGHSPMRAEALEEERLTDKCIDNNEGPETDIDPRCFGAATEAMFMDRYNVTITYNEESKSFGPAVKQYYNYLRYWLLPYVTDDTEDSTQTFAPANTITSALEIDPRLDNVNAWIRTPSTKTDFSKIPVNPMMTSILRFNPAVSYARRIRGESYCGHGGSKFFTFDGVEFYYNLTSCWHLLAKDCSGHSRIAVLTRRIKNNETEVEVNLDNYRIVHLSPGLNASVNEKSLQLAENTVAEIADEAGTVLLQLEAAETPERLIRVNMPAHGFHIIYTGYSTLVMADRRMRGRLCGICGDFDGESVGEFRKPQDNQARSSQEYASSYAVPNVGCDRHSTY